MAEKGFGVKEVNLIGASGTPTITSPNNLNLNANNVAISTNVSIGGTLSVTGNVSIGGTLTYEDVTNIDSVGVITARTSIKVGTGATIKSNGDLFVGGQSILTGIVTARGGVSIPSSNYLNLGALGASGAGTEFRIYRKTVFGDENRIEGESNTPIVIKGLASDVSASFTPGAAAELYWDNSKKLETNTSGVNVVGALTVNGSAISIDPTATDVQVAYELLSTSASGAGWRITGNGIVNTVNNPDLYLIRGQKYRFINNSGGSHPFRIQSDSSTAYSTGVTNNNASSGNIDFVPLNDAPARLYYNCTNHGGMLGNIYLRDAAGGNTKVGVSTFSGKVTIESSTSPTNNKGNFGPGSLTLQNNSTDGTIDYSQGIVFTDNANNDSDGGWVHGAIVCTGSTGYNGNMIFGIDGNDNRNNNLSGITQKMTIAANGNIGAPNGNNIYNASDERLKENIIEITDGLSKIKKLKPISFTWKEGWDVNYEGKTEYGFGAQTTQAVDELLVEPFSLVDAVLNGEIIKNPLRVNEKYIIPLLVKAVQELSAEVAALKAK